jgi:DNA-binding response OmpR family regulator
MTALAHDMSAHARSSAVLLVESEPMLRLTMTKFLRSSGCEVTACPDLQSGAAALASGIVCPVLIVFGARVLDAETAATARRLQELAPGVPILGIADMIEPACAESSARWQGLRFLAPPFDMPDVLRAVRSHLRQAGALPQAAEALET